MSLLTCFLRPLLTTGLLLASITSVAVDVPDANVLEPGFREKTFGDYTVHFSTFSSAFITPEVAEVYGITRARNQLLVNVSVTQTDAGKTSLGLGATINGTASNLLQQQRVLDFAEINEGNATYYLAPLKHTNEEVYNFSITVTPTGTNHEDAAPMTVKFSRKLYVEEAE
ncbi:DUF4426 domain-containing protein [Gilvimarinus japonicus]|uniref:DUF4426 domain-containing protein n=1 Tax=Gilvimarinus japonicus TaxID=1796469 RepID=A0ABV7HSN3_9GAMM